MEREHRRRVVDEDGIGEGRRAELSVTVIGKRKSNG